MIFKNKRNISEVLELVRDIERAIDTLRMCRRMRTKEQPKEVLNQLKFEEEMAEQGALSFLGRIYRITLDDK